MAQHLDYNRYHRTVIWLGPSKGNDQGYYEGEGPDDLYLSAADTAAEAFRFLTRFAPKFLDFRVETDNLRHKVMVAYRGESDRNKAQKTLANRIWITSDNRPFRIMCRPLGAERGLLLGSIRLEPHSNWQGVTNQTQTDRLTKTCVNIPSFDDVHSGRGLNLVLHIPRHGAAANPLTQGQMIGEAYKSWRREQVYQDNSMHALEYTMDMHAQVPETAQQILHQELKVLRAFGTAVRMLIVVGSGTHSTLQTGGVSHPLRQKVEYVLSQQGVKHEFTAPYIRAYINA